MPIDMRPAQALRLWHDVSLATVRENGADLSPRQITVLLTVYLEPPPHTVRGLAGYRAFKDRPTGDKTLRAEPLAAQAAIRNVKLVAGGWNGDYIDYLTAFPNGPVKDPIDASSGAFARLALHAPRRVKPPRPVVHSGREQFE